MPRTTQKQHWSPHKRTRIRVMYEQGYSRSEIARKEGVPVGSVHGIATRYTQQISAQSKPRPGRPEKLSEADKRHIKRLIRSDPCITKRQIIATIPLHVSVNTLASFLKSEGIQHGPLLQRPKSTATNLQHRTPAADTKQRKQQPLPTTS
ncbi:hypothetical protein CCMA1212_006515 [Trichoderma ghanense]|uniref:Transposase IS30-like HTH domain-containing protein n=1 Tax=Trichoderma ghanense TaxID=65468 RepID=A0ABY2H251_9HYPO